MRFGRARARLNAALRGAVAGKLDAFRITGTPGTAT
jgi:hypothetical protein